jgi:hypothetical protein
MSRRSAYPASWNDGQVARAVEVLHLVVRLVVQARGVHPPLDVAAAIGARRAYVFADGERNVATGAADLVGQLRPGGRGADDQDAALGQFGRLPYCAGVICVMSGGRARASSGTHATLNAPVAITTARQRQVPSPDSTSYPLSRARTAVTGQCVAQGRCDVPCVRVEKADCLAERAEVVRPLALIAEARADGFASWASAASANPSARCAKCSPPGAAFEHDVVDTPPREPPAHREAGLAGPDDDRRRAHHGAIPARRSRQATSTVTLVGLVMMSYTAERFCDCATIALMSSGEASASIL